MKMRDIAGLAEQHGDWDDFGRWTFRDDDRLLSFVLAVQELAKPGKIYYTNQPPYNPNDLRISDKEKVAHWMLTNGYSTGHFETIEDLLKELESQIKEKNI